MGGDDGGRTPRGSASYRVPDDAAADDQLRRAGCWRILDLSLFDKRGEIR